MKLTHLGAAYTPFTTDIETMETDIELRFLGRRFRMRAPKAMPPTASSGYLTYRGVRYQA
jgi:hypothetical protein